MVEVDESKMRERKYNKGHRVEGMLFYFQYLFEFSVVSLLLMWCLGGGIERTKERKTIVASVPDRKEKTLTKLLRDHVNFGSIVHTDGWKG